MTGGQRRLMRRKRRQMTTPLKFDPFPYHIALFLKSIRWPIQQLNSHHHSRNCVKLTERMLNKIAFLLCGIFPIIVVAKFVDNKGGRGKQSPIFGKTPCCFDQLGGLLCGRQKKLNLAGFLHKCMQNADFAFVQCCRTCFDHTEEDLFRLDYKKSSTFLLTAPESAQCWDRRTPGWCKQFAQGNMEKGSQAGWKKRRGTAQMDCSNVPIAFRLCRKSCGFCGTTDSPVKAVYDEQIAKSPVQCYSPARGLAIEQENLHKNSVYRDFVNRFYEQRMKKKRRGKTRITNLALEEEAANLH